MTQGSRGSYVGGGYPVPAGGAAVKDLLSRAVTVGRREGLTALAGRGLQFVGGRLLDDGPDADRKRAIRNRYRENPRYLNVGGGDFVREHWRVLDYHTDWYDYDEVFVDHDVDLEERDRWPIPDDSHDLVYSSHTLEHLTNATVRHTLEEMHRVLKPGGGVRINVPDIGLACRWYEADTTAWFTDVWLEGYEDDVYFADGKCPPGYELEFYLLSFFATYLARVRHDETDFEAVREDYRRLERDAFLNRYAGRIRDEWQAEYPGWHRNWFDHDRLARLLREAGFTDVVRSRCRQSRHPELCTSQFDHRPHISLFVEGRTPSSG